MHLTNVGACISQGRAKLAHREEGTERHANLRRVMDALDEIEWPEMEDDLQPGDEDALPPEEMRVELEAHARLKYGKPTKLHA